MTEVNRSALVLHTAEQMFDLINDVRQYPEFLPGCVRTEVIHESESEIEATLYLAKAGLKYSFTTRNQLQRPQRMEIALVEGPFSSFSGTWVLTPLSEEACKVEFTLRFEFKGSLTSMAMNKLFNSVATSMVEVFVQRADKVYG